MKKNIIYEAPNYVPSFLNTNVLFPTTAQSLHFALQRVSATFVAIIREL